MLADLSGMVFVWAFIGLIISALYFLLVQTYFYCAVSVLLTCLLMYDLAVSFQLFYNDSLSTKRCVVTNESIETAQGAMLISLELEILNDDHLRSNLEHG